MSHLPSRHLIVVMSFYPVVSICVLILQKVPIARSVEIRIRA